MEPARLGIILDTGLLIDAERGGRDADALIARLASYFPQVDVAISVVSVVEFTHGIYRAKNADQRERRARFADDIFRVIAVQPITFRIALLAGKMLGEQMARGITVDFADLLIGCTALHMGYDLATLNRKHFELIPGLSIVSPPTGPKA
jgi:predicted nucleic acid-binding protein